MALVLIHAVRGQENNESVNLLPSISFLDE